MRAKPDLVNSPLWKRADERFFWNRYLSEDLMARNLDEFILPVMSGYVCSQVSSIKVSSSNVFAPHVL
jgi:hypothetical protein